MKKSLSGSAFGPAHFVRFRSRPFSSAFASGMPRVLNCLYLPRCFDKPPAIVGPVVLDGAAKVFVLDVANRLVHRTDPSGIKWLQPVPIPGNTNLPQYLAPSPVGIWLVCQLTQYVREPVHYVVIGDGLQIIRPKDPMYMHRPKAPPVQIPHTAAVTAETDPRNPWNVCLLWHGYDKIGTRSIRCARGVRHSRTRFSIPPGPLAERARALIGQ